MTLPPDIRFALRSICRRPIVSAAVVLPIAFAIALNTALFSILDGLLFRPLPFRSPHQLLAVDFRRAEGRISDLAILPQHEGERQRIRSALEASPLIAGAAHTGYTSNPWSDSTDLGIHPAGVNSKFFPLFGLQPTVGRLFKPEDEVTVDAAVKGLALPVVVGHDLWQRAFAGDPSRLGVTDLAGYRVRIVGVMPPGVKFPGETNLWVATRQPNTHVPAYLRVNNDASVARLRLQFPELQFTPIPEALRSRGAGSVPLLFGSACLLLIVAWVQVASLSFATAVGRARELGVRLALGSSPGRISRGIALENGGLLGLACALALLTVTPLTTFLVTVLPAELTRGHYLEVDGRALTFGVLLSVVGVMVLTLIQVRLFVRSSVIHLLRGHVGSLPFRTERLRRVLLVIQVGLTTTLLHIAGLMAHSFQRATVFDYGFESDRVLLFTPPIPPLSLSADLSKYRSNDPEIDARLDEKQQRTRASLEALSLLDEVIACAAFRDIPLVTGGSRSSTTVPGKSTGSWTVIEAFNERPIPSQLRVRTNTVSEDFVRALGATLVVGRTFDRDDPSTAHGVVINETLANRLAPALFEGRVPPGIVNSTIYVRSQRSRVRVIGVLKDLVHSTPTEAAEPEVFLPSPRVLGSRIAIRTRTDVEKALPEIRATLQRIWGSDLPPWHFTLLREAWEQGLAPFRAQAMLVSFVASVCVPLAAIGIIGALLYSVQIRTKEIAIRLAIGAEPASVRWSVIRHAFATVATGLVLGSGLGYFAGRLASHQLFNVHAADPMTIISVSGFLLTLAWMAALIPARHAARTEPADALRHE